MSKFPKKIYITPNPVRDSGFDAWWRDYRRFEDDVEYIRADTARCPHITTSKGGTSYCNLAESNAKNYIELLAEKNRLEKKLARLKAQGKRK